MASERQRRELRSRQTRAPRGPLVLPVSIPPTDVHRFVAGPIDDPGPGAPAQPVTQRPAQSHAVVPSVVAPNPRAPIARSPRVGASMISIAPKGSLPTEPEEESDGGDQPNISLHALKAAPPWLVSFIVHAALLIVLALILVPLPTDQVVKINAIFAEHLGEQLDDEPLRLTTNPLEQVEQQLVTPDDLPPVENPLAAPAHLEPSLVATAASSEQDAPMIGMALSGREKGFKQALLAAYGGNQTTESAVHRGLLWLKRNQRRDGSWSLVGPYQDGGQTENQVAATAMALLAFQGAGHTHRAGEFKPTVDKGWNWLKKQQDMQGDFWNDAKGTYNHRLYSQAQATIAICELYGMTRDPEFREPAQRAIDYAVKIQAAEGGWRYHPGSDSDTSVTGWFVMGLQSGMMAGLAVPSPTMDRVEQFLNSVASEDGSLYRYRPERGPTVPMTAEGLLCRQYLGWKRDDPRLVAGVGQILANPIQWSEQNVYYWYYATQVVHHMEGDVWDQWNVVMRQAIPENQVTKGNEAGSWSPEDDQWGSFGGRLYVTCLCVYMMEVYYRHLPIYSPVYRLGM